jgi:spore coat polysaccharide biosynthesis protein SpsF
MLTAIIQARLSSTRFPRKVFANICKKPLIWHIVDRLRYCQSITDVVLATTENPADDELAQWGHNNKLKVFRGSESDVLSRYYFAAKKFNADNILRITSDDPFKDPDVIDNVYKIYYEGQLDFAYNNNPPSFPEGLDTEIFSFSSIKKAYQDSKDPFEREHVTQYFYRNSDLFKQKNFSYKSDLSYLRWTIDTQEDLSMVSIIYEKLYKENQIFKLDDILKLIEQNQFLTRMNQNVKRSSMYTNTKKTDE